ncbi:tetratricopeptide repeat protein, partial [Xanthovirga aplysinae]|uniref:tetratricopeptide repeat protein n=1 Tax=Xanthovirga aplysinae TaxID=2529853 RepID=UPI003CCDF4CE|nr:hypothetical protein [Xanthovirga aplysinae]
MKNCRRLIKYLFFILLVFGLSSDLIGQDKEKIALANEYYAKGDLNKAGLLYKELLRDRKNISFIHNNYFHLLLDSAYYREAQRYLNKLLRWYPESVTYQVEKAVVLKRKGEEQESQESIYELVEKVKSNQHKLQLVAQQLTKYQMMEHAIYAYKEGRKIEDSPAAYSLQLASLYRLQNNKSDMILEYLLFLDENPSRINYVRNILQNFLTEEKEQQAFKQLILARVRKEPENKNYPELLIWVNLQQKNFYGAFVQARAMDKRWKTKGTEVMKIAHLALKNEEYELAVKFYQYVIETYPGESTYFLARKMLIESREAKLKNTFPVDKSGI